MHDEPDLALQVRVVVTFGDGFKETGVEVVRPVSRRCLVEPVAQLLPQTGFDELRQFRDPLAVVGAHRARHEPQGLGHLFLGPLEVSFPHAVAVECFEPGGVASEPDTEPAVQRVRRVSADGFDGGPFSVGRFVDRLEQSEDECFEVQPDLVGVQEPVQVA